MSVIKFRWKVPYIDNVITQFDTQKVYRAVASTGPWVEITTPSTMVDLVAGQSVYFFDDLTGDPTYWYASSYYNSTTLLESGLSYPPVQGGNPGYISLTDVRNAGVTTTQATDDEIWNSIEMWSQFIDRATRIWFENRSLDFKIDGTDARMLWFKVPIIEIDELYMNNDFDTVISSDQYEVYNNLGEGVRDDRFDPKIALSDQWTSDLYERLLIKGKFIRGRKNQKVVGSFGFIEPDGSPPALIKRAMMKLVYNHVTSTNPYSPFPLGPITREQTDGHSITYGQLYSVTKPGTVLLTGDSEVDSIINFYRPKAMRVV